MPAEHLTPGFFGKIPAAGDFVSRNLPATFVQAWDRWAARHLAPQLAGRQEGYPPLRFALRTEETGPATGVVLASADRAGRAFPLTIAAAAEPPAAMLPGGLEAWFLALEEAGIEALTGETDADALALRLRGLPLPAEARGTSRDGMVFWTAWREPVRVEPDDPRATLLGLLAVPAGAA